MNHIFVKAKSIKMIKGITLTKSEHENRLADPDWVYMSEDAYKKWLKSFKKAVGKGKKITGHINTTTIN